MPKKAANDQNPRSKKAACTTCGAPAVKGFEPFCSQRCADVDLGRWFQGSYAFPGEPMRVIDGGYEDDED
jgi:endogenous inhibitor of DNA gyrase (YacG/DUF329 family)